MGLILAFLSALSTTAKDVVSKAVSKSIHPDISTCASFFFALPFYAVITTLAYVLGYEDLVFSPQFVFLVILRSITDVCAEGCKMRALALGDISLVTGFLSLSPLILIVISPFITADAVTPVDATGIILIVLGSLLLLQKNALTGEIFQLRAILYALAASCAFALNHCFDRLAVSTSSPLIAGFSMTLLASLFTLPLAVRHRHFMQALTKNRRPLLLRGAFETAQLLSKLVAMSFLEAHIVVGILRCSLLSSVASGRLIFKEPKGNSRLLASVVIYIGLLILIWGHL